MHLVLISTLILGAALNVVGLKINTTRHEAPIVRGNPTDVYYEVSLLYKTSTKVRGWLIGTPSKDGVGVEIRANFWGFPDEGPYQYHIHEAPIPANGDCAAAGPHLDPYKRGETPPCDIDAPESCQVGDLSGKHGPIWIAPGEAFVVKYTDFFLSTSPANPAYFGNRSIVLHTANGTRLNCGNFREVRHKHTTVPNAEEKPTYTTARGTSDSTTRILPIAAEAITETPRPPTASITSPMSFLSAAPTHAVEFSTSVMLATIVAFML
ncbi:hypothetical protein DTO027B5_189 [Paecilomyces variotii]|nr:hypothetical protein DTO027B3_2566 [Paecilomyces variotii]KAJ9338037.1 hypothetical protein DTO027B5_189 [Paecilomyces variotii]